MQSTLPNSPPAVFFIVKRVVSYRIVTGCLMSDIAALPHNFYTDIFYLYLIWKNGYQ